jgi:polysaccharide biosynthesis protein PslH
LESLMQPLRILYIVPYVPNLIRVRPFNLIRNLAERGHAVTVATLYSNERELQEAQDLKQHVFDVKAMPLTLARSLWNSAAALPSRIPLQAMYCWEPSFANALCQMVHEHEGEQQYDVIHVEHLRGAQYGLNLKKDFAGKPGLPPVVWDSVDCITLLFRQAATGSRNIANRILTRLELGRTEAYEGWLARQFDHVVVTSSLDKKELASLMPPGSPISSISVVHNGVDLNYFRPDPSVKREPASLVVSGKMSYHANATMALHLVQDIMPIVWARCPDAKVYIVGKDPSREIQALAQNPAVVVTGTVEDIRPFLQKATVAVTPITYGTGIQNKVLEAMACATPVVSSSQAVSALRIVSGRDALVAQEPIDFAGAVLQLLRDPEQQKRIGEGGRAYVEAHHQWPEITAQLEGIYMNVIRASRNSSER